MPKTFRAISVAPGWYIRYANRHAYKPRLPRNTRKRKRV